jgi:hypothetical protein
MKCEKTIKKVAFGALGRSVLYLPRHKGILGWANRFRNEPGNEKKAAVIS